MDYKYDSCNFLWKIKWWLKLLGAIWWDGMSKYYKEKGLTSFIPTLKLGRNANFNLLCLDWIQYIYSWIADIFVTVTFANDSLELGNIAQLAGEMLKLPWAFFKTTSKDDTPNHTSKCKNESQRDKIEYTGFLNKINLGRFCHSMKFFIFFIF